MPANVEIVSQGSIVAESLKDYLTRHPEMSAKCMKGGGCRYLTTENVGKFEELASLFLGCDVKAEHVDLSKE